MRAALGWGIALIAVGGSLAVGLGHGVTREEPGNGGATLPEAASSGREHPLRTSPAAPVRTPAQGNGSGLSELERGFGGAYEVERGSDGRIASIRAGARERLARAAPGYSPRDARAVGARAREALSAVALELGIEDSAPLGEPEVHPGPVSAQAFFGQTYEGFALLGYGTVTVDLGPEGELYSIQSDYLPGLRVSPAKPQISVDQARLRALAATARPGAGGTQVYGGRLVVWVPSPAQAAEARLAYEFSREGQKAIIDAGTGELIRRVPRVDF